MSLPLDINKLQDRILNELSQLIQHLEKYKEKHWSNYFNKVRTMIDNGDMKGIEVLNNMCGGMGSFFDLIISDINGYSVEKDEENFANKELMKLADSVFKTADEIKRKAKLKS